ncbi:MAG: hypothetical protein IT294_15205 [Deltaproteobacteria bacterium]|nr:hypothetical protein [Deltaproteobacteria bacterium]
MSVAVTRTATEPTLAFAVEVRDGRSSSRHTVTADPALVKRLAAGRSISDERFVEAVFEFLLEREPKDAILARFDVSIVSRYFPEFEREIGKHLP